MMITSKQKSIIANLCWQSKTDYNQLSETVQKFFRVDSIVYLNSNQANELITYLQLKSDLKKVKSIRLFNPFTFFKQLLKAI